MVERYIAQLTVRDEDGPGPDLLRRLAEDVVLWTRRDIGWTQFPHPGMWDLGGKEHIRVEAASASGSLAWRLRWQQPDASDKPLLWFSEVRLATLGDDVECRIEVRVTSDASEVRPEFASVGRPRLVPNVVTKYPSFFLGQRVDAQPWFVDAPRIPSFVERLASSDRRLPIVLVTPDNSTGEPLLDPYRLADQLAALADVCVLSDSEASWRLAEEVGRPFSCFNGAVRVYWPGFDMATDDPFQHPLWLPAWIRAQPGRIEKTLFSRMCLATARLVTVAPIWKAVNDAGRTEREDTLRSELEKAGASHAAAQGLLDDMRRLVGERDDLQLRVWELESETVDLQRDIDRLKESMRQITRSVAGETSTPEVEIDRVLTAVRVASERFSSLRFLESALESARNSNYNWPDRVFDAFQALDELAEIRKRGSLGMDIERWLSERGIGYAAHLSPTTRSKYGRHYTFRVDGVDLLMEEHLVFGNDGDPDKCLRVHMVWDSGAAVWLIGHVGRHLRNTMS
ncbi:MAG: hypothetical protein IT300_14965 [Dehalococcoidia bacterium]|nr:hypothetical protein [Dehalococcoidia bacterium]